MEDFPNFLRFEDPEQHYQMLEFIGEGNFGTVLKIKDKVTEELFALKIIPMDLEVLEQIIPDLVELKKIDNPFFLNYYDIFYKDQNLWIVMEYCEFGAITEIPKLLNRFLKEEEVGPIIFQILSGLNYLHNEMKVDHLAIKPTNILIDQYGRIKISDYGLTFKFLKNLVDFENLLQSAHYLSPEMTENSPKISFKSDIWCLGITIIELLQGTPPFVMMNNSQVLEKLKNQSENFQLEQKDQFSTFVQQLIEKCLKNEIDERPSAQEILDSDQFLQQFKNTNVQNDTNSGVLKQIIEQIYETANGVQQTQQSQQSQENLSQINSENVDQIQGGKKQSELQDIQENLSYSNFSQNQGQLKSTDALQKPQNQQDQLFSSKLFENLSCASRENQSQKNKESQTLLAKNKEQGIIDNLESNISLSLDQNELEPRSEYIQSHSQLQKSDVQKTNQKSKTNFSQNQSQQSEQQIENNKNLQNSQNAKINKESISEIELEQQQQQEQIRQKYFEEQKKEQEERAKRLQELEKQYNKQNYSEINLSDMDDVDNTSQQNNNQSQKSSQQFQEKQKSYLSISGLNESQQKISEDQQKQLSQNQNLSQRKTNKQDLSENPMNDPLGEYEEYIQESFENYSNNNSENFQEQRQISNNNQSQQKFQGHHLVQSEHSFAKKEKQKKSISNVSDQNSVKSNFE
ncbi:Protein kinase-like domain [Pseudocohnilembus persalinus]|uniref:Protein kinase-like domain n=1 Tax=Pseudocohnilembus persalinus TaxID=266149 RepID=A0A0V0R9Y4_PSEPJ|nr:Protein kinase-like domain [Pseudocohnilembus persalinus]|eukprot:KRX11093.1 Protein kinase-like domain [Pseudocohnilembus persalinus]